MSDPENSSRPRLDQPLDYHFQKLLDFETTEFYAARGKNVAYSVVGLLFALGGWGLVRGGLNADTPLIALVFGWLVIVLFGGASLLILGGSIFRLPKLILSNGGLHLINYISKDHWKWSEIGPMVISTRQYKGAKAYYICAFTNANYDLLTVHNQAQTPDHINADIIVPIPGFGPGVDHVTVEQLEAVLNAWRDKFGHPTVDVSPHLTRTDATVLANKIRNRTVKYCLFLLLIVLVWYGGYLLALFRSA